MYGTIFKQIRLDHHLTQREVAAGLVSGAALSRFERGQADLPLGLLSQLLRRMGVTLPEYIAMTDQSASAQTQFAAQLDQRYRARDAPALAALCQRALHDYHVTHEARDLVRAAFAASHYFDLTGQVLLKPGDVAALVDKLAAATHWYLPALQTVANVATILPPTRALAIAKLIVADLPAIHALGRGSFEGAVDALLSVHRALIIRELPLAAVSENLLQALSLPPTMLTLRLRRRFLSLLFSYVQGDAQAVARLEQLLELLRRTDNAAVADELAIAFTHIHRRPGPKVT